MTEEITELICELEHLAGGNIEHQKKAIIKKILALLPSDIDGIIVNEEYFPREEKKNNYITLEELSDQYNC